MSIFQLGALCFAVVMAYIVRINRKKAGLSPVETSFWITLWFLFACIALFPNVLIGITGLLRFQRVFDLLVVVSMMIVTFVTLVNYFSNKSARLSLELLTRAVALEDQTKRNSREQKSVKTKDTREKK